MGTRIMKYPTHELAIGHIDLKEGIVFEINTLLDNNDQNQQIVKKNQR